MNNGSVLITQEQENNLSVLTTEIENGFKKLYAFRSEFLMRNSVLAMNATPDGQYWQAMLERNVQYWEFMRLKIDYKEKLCDIELKEAQLSKKEDDISHSTNRFDTAIMQTEIKKTKLLIEKDELSIIHMKKEAEQRLREILTWTKIIRELEPNLKYSLNNPEECQAEEWANLYAKKIEILKQTGSTDMDGTINTLLVGDKIFKDKYVANLIEQEQKRLSGTI